MHEALLKLLGVGDPMKWKRRLLIKEVLVLLVADILLLGMAILGVHVMVSVCAPR